MCRDATLYHIRHMALTHLFCLQYFFSKHEVSFRDFHLSTTQDFMKFMMSILFAFPITNCNVAEISHAIGCFPLIRPTPPPAEKQFYNFSGNIISRLHLNSQLYLETSPRHLLVYRFYIYKGILFNSIFICTHGCKIFLHRFFSVVFLFVLFGWPVAFQVIVWIRADFISIFDHALWLISFFDRVLWFISSFNHAVRLTR